MKNFLCHYRTTPHTVTGVSPAKMLMNRELRGKLPSLTGTSVGQEDIHDKDALHKLKRNIAADHRRGARDQEIKPGDTVLCKNLRKTSKLDPNFEVQPYEVIDKQGNAVIVQRPDSPVRMRNAAHVKKFDGEVSPSTLSAPIQYWPHLSLSQLPLPSPLTLICPQAPLWTQRTLALCPPSHRLANRQGQPGSDVHLPGRKTILCAAERLTLL